jgi:hypothetical protein
MSILRLRLTTEQAEQLRPVLEVQRDGKQAGIFAVVGLDWCRNSGEPTAVLHCKLTDWPTAKRVCRLLKGANAMAATKASSANE